MFFTLRTWFAPGLLSSRLASPCVSLSPGLDAPVTATDAWLLPTMATGGWLALLLATFTFDARNVTALRRFGVPQSLGALVRQVRGKLLSVSPMKTLWSPRPGLNR